MNEGENDESFNILNKTDLIEENNNKIQDMSTEIDMIDENCNKENIEGINQKEISVNTRKDRNTKTIVNTHKHNEIHIQQENNKLDEIVSNFMSQIQNFMTTQLSEIRQAVSTNTKK